MPRCSSYQDGEQVDSRPSRGPSGPSTNIDSAARRGEPAAAILPHCAMSMARSLSLMRTFRLSRRATLRELCVTFGGSLGLAEAAYKPVRPPSRPGVPAEAPCRWRRRPMSARFERVPARYATVLGDHLPLVGTHGRQHLGGEEPHRRRGAVRPPAGRWRRLHRAQESG